jgi:hypothetical protein
VVGCGAVPLLVLRSMRRWPAQLARVCRSRTWWQGFFSRDIEAIRFGTSDVIAACMACRAISRFGDYGGWTFRRVAE